jgi:hypothetical protein
MEGAAEGYSTDVADQPNHSATPAWIPIGRDIAVTAQVAEESAHRPRLVLYGGLGYEGFLGSAEGVPPVRAGLLQRQDEVAQVSGRDGRQVRIATQELYKVADAAADPLDSTGAAVLRPGQDPVDSQPVAQCCHFRLPRRQA